MPRCLADGMTCAANASLISTRSMSSIVRFARFSAWRDASIGPRPMISGFSARHARRDDARQRLDAELLGLGVAHHDHRGRAVVERARVARGDRTVGPEHRLQRRELLDGRAGARAVVLRHDRAVGRGDRRDLPLEEPVLLVLDRELLRPRARTRPSPRASRLRPRPRSPRSRPSRCTRRADPVGGVHLPWPPS